MDVDPALEVCLAGDVPEPVAVRQPRWLDRRDE